jgi:hypothetical protein
MLIPLAIHPELEVRIEFYGDSNYTPFMRPHRTKHFIKRLSQLRFAFDSRSIGEHSSVRKKMNTFIFHKAERCRSYAL